MMNIFDYVEKYGNLTFNEKDFNDIDNLVFCSLSYLNFSLSSINEANHTIGYLGREYLKIYKFSEIKKLGIPQKNGYKLLKIVINKKRYKNIVLHNYVYNANKDKQFSAMMFKINNNLEYICFEGTDDLVSGWKEDFEMSYKFPVPSQKDAIKYVNKYVKVNGPDIIIGGHSKGGNLALVSAMFIKQYKQFRIKKVYSNDGPGLREKEYNMGRYRRIKRKYIHIIPEHSIVGMLLNNDNNFVVKTNTRGILSHALAYWMIQDDQLIETKISNKSIEFENNLKLWLEKNNSKEREKLVKTVFKVLEDNDIYSFAKIGGINKIIKIINGIRNIDKHTKNLMIDLISSTIDLNIFKD